MKHIFFIALFALAINSAFAQKIKYPNDIPSSNIRIDLSQDFARQLNEVIDDLEYIPLQTNKNVILNTISDAAAIVENRLGVYNKIGSKHFFLIYDLHGTLIKQIDLSKEVKLSNIGEVNTVREFNNEFVINSNEKRIHINYDGSKIYWLSNTTTYIDSCLINNSLWKYHAFDSLKNSGNLLTINNTTKMYYSNNSPKISFTSLGFPKNRHFSPLFINKDNPYRYFCPNDYFKIFELSEDSVTHEYNFIFPANKTIDTTLNHNTIEDFIKYLSKNDDKILLINLLLRHQNYLIFTTNISIYAYNIDSGSFLDFRNVIPSKSNDFISLFFHNLIYTDGENLYTIVFPDQVRQAKQKCKEEKHIMRKEYARLQNHKNPILVKFKLKQL